MKYADMSPEQQAWHDGLGPKHAAREAEKADRKAARDARLRDVGSVGLPELREIVQGIIDELKERG